MTFLSQKQGQFTYFALQLGESRWSGKDILDFGGNIGNILRDPNSTIDPSRYWCIDVDREAVQEGRRRFPEAHWLHYDRFCFFFNPKGRSGLALPNPGLPFDYIVAYSVFTNTAKDDMLELVRQLRGLLKGEGKLAFTFIDPSHHSWPGEYAGDNLMWRLERENPKRDVGDLWRRAAGARWCVLVNGDDLYIETDQIKPYPVEMQRTFHTFYAAEYMRGLFPEAEVLPPANGEMQHCCVMSAPA